MAKQDRIFHLKCKVCDKPFVSNGANRKTCTDLSCLEIYQKGMQLKKISFATQRILQKLNEIHHSFFEVSVEIQRQKEEFYKTDEKFKLY
jgi:hypothetical protein